MKKYMSHHESMIRVKTLIQGELVLRDIQVRDDEVFISMIFKALLKPLSLTPVCPSKARGS